MTAATLRDQFASQIRTLVPIAVGFVLSLIAREYGIVLDEASSAGLVSGLSALASAVYYVVVRLLESKVPAVGWLLGLPVAPSYDNGKVVPGEVVQ